MNDERSCCTKHMYLFLYGLLHWLLSNYYGILFISPINLATPIALFYFILAIILVTTADNKYLYFIWKKLKHISNVTHICYSIFIHNSLSFPKSRSLVDVTQSRYGNRVLKIIVKYAKLDYRTSKFSMDIEFLNSSQRFLHTKCHRRDCKPLTNTNFHNAFLYSRKLRLKHWKLIKFVHNWIRWKMI